ncbi:uncharacterized protein LOC107610471 [Arachis ipaensis]|uniref:uncharacterized protein LOC107610471 n=1 Tax=Arachis ipaensis TaxID=130454 RepID=UPI0007AF7937|nr:uncharacterized protein LOC107610471 [Arachis ipaensis]
MKKPLMEMIRANADLFAWTPADMPGIDPWLVSHHLAVKAGTKPVAQRKRKMSQERAEEVARQTASFLEAGFIRELDYSTWLSNVVLVKKHNGGWRMCVDYSDLNKACPKDCYPLPNIDALVDAAAGYRSGSQPREVSSSSPDEEPGLYQRRPTTCQEVNGFIPIPRRFEWTPACEEAFNHFKQILAAPPVLGKPKVEEPLYLYLSVTEEALATVLVREEGKTQEPVYFVSRVLQGPELKYSKLEKLALALLVSSRRLRQYFQSHRIVVRTDQAIRQVLQKPDLAGRMMTWAIELSQYDLQYEPRHAIKAQAMADFLVITRFGIPEVVISDNGTQFTDKKFMEFLSGLGIKQKFSSVEHPQTNGQVEATNKVILLGLKKRLDNKKGTWADELASVLWSYRTTEQSATGETPFRLTYGVDAVIPVEIGEPSPRLLLAGMSEAVEKDLVEETREMAHLSETALKQRIALRYNAKGKGGTRQRRLQARKTQRQGNTQNMEYG